MVSRRSTRSRHNDGRVPSEADPEGSHPHEDDVDDDEEMMDEDDIEEVTRCICGNPELQLLPNNPDYDSVDTGFFIQCEECQVWQHGYCVGIKDEAEAPDKYWCELCKPELHTLVYKGPKDKKSLYTPVTDKRLKKAIKKVKDEREEAKANSSSRASPVNATTGTAPPPSSSATTATTTGPNLPSSPDHARHKRERSRGTLNSRDAEYEMMLKKALEESAKESGVQPEDPELSEYTRERTSRRRTRHADEPKREDLSEGALPEDDREHELQSKEDHDTKRRRLERHAGERSGESADALGKPATDASMNSSTDKAAVSEVTPRSAKAQIDATANTTVGSSSAQTDDDNAVSRSASSASKKKRPKRSAASSSANKAKADASSLNVRTTPKKSARSKEEIDADKPTKPRIPQQRISMYEMRKRTSAILEFLVRTQTELRDSFECDADITEFVEDSPDLNKANIKEVLAANHQESMTLMEGLTKKIIDWNSKYGENSV